MTVPSQLINKFSPVKQKVFHTITSASKLQAGQSGKGDNNTCKNLNQQNSMNNFMASLNESFRNWTDTLVNVLQQQNNQTENVVL